MPENPLYKKLRLQPGQKTLVLNADPAWLEDFAAQNQVETQPKGTYEFILLFAPDKATLNELVPIVRKAATATAMVWVAYYKGSSKIQTDLTRDKGWESMPETEWQPLSLISLNDKWSAFSFRLSGGKAVKGRRSMRDTSLEPVNTNPYIDALNRVITLPEDLAEALVQHVQAAEFYNKLSFSNRKEYVVWVTEATRQNRIEESVKKLNEGLKNPREKAV
jgi:hypothetical protein